MVNFLMEVHTDEYIGVNREIRPEDVPVAGIWIALDSPAELLGHFRDDGVLGHCIIRLPLLETLIVIRFRFMVSFRMRSTLGLCMSSLAFSYSESSSASELSSVYAFLRGIPFVKIKLLIVKISCNIGSESEPLISC